MILFVNWRWWLDVLSLMIDWRPLLRHILLEQWLPHHKLPLLLLLEGLAQFLTVNLYVWVKHSMLLLGQNIVKFCLRFLHRLAALRDLLIGHNNVAIIKLRELHRILLLGDALHD